MSNEIEQLKAKIEQFRNNIKDYKSKLYDEYNTRADFIDVLFSAFGWDMYNNQGVIEQFREVVREDKIIIQGNKKAPDYSFKIGPQIVFYVEAKKPSVDIKNDPEPAFQLRRYAHTQGLSLSILTDFEEIAVYDTRIKPEAKDSAAVARVFYCTYDQLFEKYHNDDFRSNFDFLNNTFGKSAILNGSFNRYAEENKNKKGTGSVDKGFLSLLNNWREKLASNVALKNDDLDEYNLNIAVQKIIDRLVFLRIAEDRLIEEENYLKNAIKSESVYKYLLQIFNEADDKYNSGLFTTEEWFKELTIENKTLTEIISEMYYPKCPYEFSVLPIEILGNAYEQFLGKTIRYSRKTKYGHTVEIDDKPEVRKAGGVFYTPDYIVDYLVEETIGNKVSKLKPELISSKRFLDPACGSGSFLIGAYDYLVRYHLQWYLANETRLKKALKEGSVYQISEKKYKLSTSKKSEILVNNIFGVDIDAQAVEVTKLSLLLKVLEDENLEYKEELFKAQHHHLLPDLSNNIKCGNSLIGSDFYSDKDLTLFGITEMRKVNSFNWKEEFSDVLKSGGFDCIIGNPPYLRIQGLQENYKDQIKYFIDKYESAVKRFDLYLLFLEKGYSLLNDSGTLGFINPHKFTNSDFGSGLRSFFVKNNALSKIISFGNNLVFDQASTYTGLFFLDKNKKDNMSFFEMENLYKGEIKTALTSIDEKDYSLIAYSTLSDDSWILADKLTNGILGKLNSIKITAKDVFSSISQGVVSTGDDIFYISGSANGNISMGYSERLDKSIEIESDILRPILKGEDVKKYKISQNNLYVIYPHYLDENKKTKPFEEEFFKKKYPLAYNYLSLFKEELVQKKIRYKTNPKYWYSLHRSRDIISFETEKIITPEISLGCNMTLDTKNLYHNTKVYSLIPKEKWKEDIKYWLGILNSNLMWFFIKTTGYVLRGGFYTFKTKYIEPFPIPIINFENELNKKIHAEIVSLVTKRLELEEQLNNTKGSQDSKIINDLIITVETQINSHVYSLYNLSNAEIEEINRNCTF